MWQLSQNYYWGRYVPMYFYMLLCWQRTLGRDPLDYCTFALTHQTIFISTFGTSGDWCQPESLNRRKTMTLASRLQFSPSWMRPRRCCWLMNFHSLEETRFVLLLMGHQWPILKLPLTILNGCWPFASSFRFPLVLAPWSALEGQLHAGCQRHQCACRPLNWNHQEHQIRAMRHLSMKLEQEAAWYLWLSVCDRMPVLLTCRTLRFLIYQKKSLFHEFGMFCTLTISTGNKIWERLTRRKAIWQDGDAQWFCCWYVWLFCL